METHNNQSKDPQTDMHYSLIDGSCAHIPVPQLEKVSDPQFRLRINADNKKNSMDQDLFDTAEPDKDLDIPLDG